MTLHTIENILLGVTPCTSLLVGCYRPWGAPPASSIRLDFPKQTDSLSRIRPHSNPSSDPTRQLGAAHDYGQMRNEKATPLGDNT